MIVQLVKNSVLDIQDSGVPYFEFGTWNEVNEILASMNLSHITQKQKFPMVLLLSDTLNGLDYDSESKDISGNIDVYIFGVAAENKRSLYRDENELPDLRIIRDNLIQSLKENGIIITGISPFDELPYNNTLLNKLEMRVNAIQLGIGIEYELTDCEI